MAPASASPAPLPGPPPALTYRWAARPQALPDSDCLKPIKVIEGQHQYGGDQDMKMRALKTCQKSQSRPLESMHALTYPNYEMTAGRQHLNRRIDGVVVWRVQAVGRDASFSGWGF